jgi:hypothetical protein
MVKRNRNRVKMPKPIPAPSAKENRPKPTETHAKSKKSRSARSDAGRGLENTAETVGVTKRLLPTSHPAETRADSPYRPHPGVGHVWTLPLAQFGGAQACRDCGRWRSEIAREEAKARKKDGRKNEV